MRECLGFNLETKQFHLCLNEILAMAHFIQNNLLQRRTELLIDNISKEIYFIASQH